MNAYPYNDDMVLLAPSLDALQDLLDPCELYAVDYCMIYKVQKLFVCVLYLKDYEIFLFL